MQQCIASETTLHDEVLKVVGAELFRLLGNHPVFQVVQDNSQNTLIKYGLDMVETLSSGRLTPRSIERIQKMVQGQAPTILRQAIAKEANRRRREVSPPADYLLESADKASLVAFAEAEDRTALFQIFEDPSLSSVDKETLSLFALRQAESLSYEELKEVHLARTGEILSNDALRARLSRLRRGLEPFRKLFEGSFV